MSRYRLEPCLPPPFWVATRTAVARCPDGQVGDPQTATVQARSTISLEHAQTKALREATCAAKAKLQCQWCATATAVGSFKRVETATACSTVSLDDARNKATELAAQHAAQFIATAEFTATCPGGTGGDPLTVERTAYSSISQQDAQNKALALATAEAQSAIICIPN